MSKKLTTEEFIEKAKKIHGNKYDYSLVVYKNNSTKVKIICPEHGIFEQRPSSHLEKRGCSKCSKNKKYTQKIVIEKARSVHGNKYDYSLVDYKNQNTKIKIICPEHGIFEQIPYSHLKGFGCNECSGRKRLTTDDFIKKAKRVHGDKYDYSLVEYKNNSTKVKIICPEHGVFEQRPNDHIRKRGCGICVQSKGERKIRKFLVKNNLKFKSEKTFNKCKNKESLPFDFYLPNQNILIEFDGIQHFKPQKYFGGKEGFKYLKINDSIKNKFTKENNIQLIRIPYWDYPNIGTILEKELINGDNKKENKKSYNNIR